MMPGIDGLQVLDELQEARRRAAGADDHRLRLDGERHRGDEEGRVRLHHQAVQERRSAGRAAATPSSAASWWPRTSSLRQNLQARYHKFSGIIGKSSRMKQVFDLIIQAAPSRSTILITGESGTGKELVARAIHSNSARSEKSFVAVNSGNLPPDLLESTLFGHVKGAFTGAVYPKKGMFDLADKGSIFFDEIGNIPIETQAKLLRVMQEREFMRLGGMETIKVDVRIIAATNVDLKHEMEEGRFREDLFYRLHVISIHLPALRERARRHPAAGAALPREVRRGERPQEHRGGARGARPADGLRLAGQRARARERDRARRGAQHRHRASAPT